MSDERHWLYSNSDCKQRKLKRKPDLSPYGELIGIFLNPKTKNMTPRVQEAIDVFLDAINNGTLAKGNCIVCAVGNLAAHAMGGTIYKTSSVSGTTLYECTEDNWDWMNLFSTSRGIQTFHNTNPDKVKSIKNVPFTINELAQIEFAFETNTKICWANYHHHSPEEIRKDQINGLAAVVKVMLSFDNQEDSVEEVFTSKAELIPI